MSQAVQMCQVPAYCGDGPGAFLSSTCGYQVARPCLCARLPSLTWTSKGGLYPCYPQHTARGNT